MQKILSGLGRTVINFIHQFGSLLMLAGSIVRYMPRIFKDRKLVLEQSSLIGADSLPLVLFIGAFTGAIAALEATVLFTKFNLIGITRPFLGGSIATAVFTELTPVLTALVIAGRVGGGMAAQLGTMCVSEQIDALEMMAIDKARYLAMPRVVAALIMMPILAVFSNSIALIGGYVLTAIKFDFTAFEFFDSVRYYFNINEIYISLSKSFVFGGLTALIGCWVGFQTTGGAEGVGRSTVRAFTLSAAAILIVDAIFGYFM